MPDAVDMPAPVYATKFLAFLIIEANNFTCDAMANVQLEQ